MIENVSIILFEKLFLKLTKQNIGVVDLEVFFQTFTQSASSINFGESKNSCLSCDLCIK